MNTATIIGIVVAVVVVLLALVAVGIVLSRRRRLSLRDDSEVGKSQIGRSQPGGQGPVTGGTPQVDKSGSYKASSGFSFTQGGGTATTEPPASVGGDVAEPLASGDERTDADGQPMVGDDASVPRDAPKRSIAEVVLPADAAEPAERAEQPEADGTDEIGEAAEAETLTPAVDTPVGEIQMGDAASVPAEAAPAPIPEAIDRDEIEPTAGRLGRLRGRLSRSQSVFGRSVLGLLGGGDLDEDSWEEIEDTLLMADLGTATTTAVVDKLRSELAAHPARSADEVRALFRSVLIDHLMPELDRSVRALPHAGHPALLLVVGVNGTGKTTTTGKLARVLVADGRRVLLGAADTFRAAAADQLQTWGERVGAQTVRGKESADPASVAFDAVSAGIDAGVDAVIVDTAGRLHTKAGLMDELGKVKRVVEKRATIDEVLLVLDATIGQNGLAQARVFAEVVDITGVVLTKLDGTAKGGIVFQVQNELRVPVKLVGLGEGADDLAPFEPAAFVDALLG